MARNIKTVVYASPEDRPRILGNTSGAEEARADFEAACPGWSKSPLAEQFVGEKPVTVDVFKQCKFARLEVLTAAEFAKAEVHYATMAMVVFDALKRGGVDAKLARKSVRLFVLPLEAGPPPRPVDAGNGDDFEKKLLENVRKRQQKH